ncbi:hypothetical protein ACWF7H_22490 [Peribacillus butanolivorans]
MKSLNFIIHAKVLTIIANVVMLRMKGSLNNDRGIRGFSQEPL